MSSIAYLNSAEGTVRSFSHVVQNKQFAALGLVLFAELATISRLVGVKVDNHQDAGGSTIEQQEAFKATISPLPEDFGEAVERNFATDTPTHLLRRLTERSDVDKVLHSTSIAESSETHPFPVQPTDSMAMESGEASMDAQGTPPKRPKHRKRKGANAIDDLFHGLE